MDRGPLDLGHDGPSGTLFVLTINILQDKCLMHFITMVQHGLNVLNVPRLHLSPSPLYGTSTTHIIPYLHIHMTPPTTSSIKFVNYIGILRKLQFHSIEQM
jgi:hypothetical protein